MIYLASDHRGYLRKEEIKRWLFAQNAKYLDVGNKTLTPNDDAIDFVIRATELMADHGDRGIFFCGSAVMVDVVANRFPHIRSCLAVSPDQVRAARNDDDVNCLSLATDHFGKEETIALVGAFLGTTFSPQERFLRRLNKLKSLK